MRRRQHAVSGLDTAQDLGILQVAEAQADLFPSPFFVCGSRSWVINRDEAAFLDPFDRVQRNASDIMTGVDEEHDLGAQSGRRSAKPSADVHVRVVDANV